MKTIENFRLQNCSQKQEFQKETDGQELLNGFL